MSNLRNGQDEITQIFLEGGKVYFCKPDATGTCDGSSWENACTFRQAVAKLVPDGSTTLYLGAGVHDANNGSDGTGTTISLNYINIIGHGDPAYFGSATRIINSHASATKILTITGERCQLKYLQIDNSGQPSTGVTGTLVHGAYFQGYKCAWRQDTSDASNATGLYFDNSAWAATMEGCLFGQLKN